MAKAKKISKNKKATVPDKLTDNSIVVPPESKEEEQLNDYGGLPIKNLKKNLGCG